MGYQLWDYMGYIIHNFGSYELLLWDINYRISQNQAELPEFGLLIFTQHHACCKGMNVEVIQLK